MSLEERRSKLEIVRDIGLLFEENAGICLPPTVVAKTLGLNYFACRKYLELILAIQKMPKIVKVRTLNSVVYRLERVLK